MITDRETNFVYVSDLLEKKSPEVFQQLVHWFDRLHIGYATLPATKDLWVVDFMPLQVREDYFVQFTYDPDYLKPKKWQPYRTDALVVCNWIGITPKSCSIIIDGGNVIKYKSKVILTSKIFQENSRFAERLIVDEIRDQLEVEQVIIIPREPKDFVGHADGMVRFIDEHTVLVNQYHRYGPYSEFGYNLRWSLQNAGLQCVELPYRAWVNEDVNDATGCYINCLEVGNYIFYPLYKLSSDEAAALRLQSVFPGREVIGIDCRKLARLGGVLNCATWNIFRRN